MVERITGNNNNLLNSSSSRGVYHQVEINGITSPGFQQLQSMENEISSLRDEVASMNAMIAQKRNRVRDRSNSLKNSKLHLSTSLAAVASHDSQQFRDTSLNEIFKNIDRKISQSRTRIQQRQTIPNPSIVSEPERLKSPIQMQRFESQFQLSSITDPRNNYQFHSNNNKFEQPPHTFTSEFQPNISSERKEVQTNNELLNDSTSKQCAQLPNNKSNSTNNNSSIKGEVRDCEKLNNSNFIDTQNIQNSFRSERENITAVVKQTNFKSEQRKEADIENLAIVNMESKYIALESQVKQLEQLLQQVVSSQTIQPIATTATITSPPQIENTTQTTPIQNSNYHVSQSHSFSKSSIQQQSTQPTSVIQVSPISKSSFKSSSIRLTSETSEVPKLQNSPKVLLLQSPLHFAVQKQQLPQKQPYIQMPLLQHQHPIINGGVTYKVITLPRIRSLSATIRSPNPIQSTIASQVTPKTTTQIISTTLRSFSPLTQIRPPAHKIEILRTNPHQYENSWVNFK